MQWCRCRVGEIVWGVLLLLFLWGCGGPTSPVTGEPIPVVEVSPDSGGPGTLVRVSGSGWQPGDSLRVRLYDPSFTEEDSLPLASAKVDAAGRFETSFTFPADAQMLGLSRVLVMIWSPATGKEVFVPFYLDQEWTVPPEPTAFPETAVPTAFPTEPPATPPSAKATMPSPEPTVASPTIIPSPEPTAVPTLQPSPTSSPEPSNTPAPTLTPTPLPTDTPLPSLTPTPVFRGWRGEYFDNPELQGIPVLLRDDASINFDWQVSAPALGMPSEAFSVRWTRSVELPADVYYFYAYSDDGVRVWLDGALILDEWHDAPGQTYVVERRVDGAKHQLRVEYYDNTGHAAIQFWWERRGDFPQWRGQYFSNADLAGAPALVRNDRAIEFDWGRAAPAASLPADGFSVRWTRKLSFDGGYYRFHVGVDDGARLYLDDSLLIDAWREGDRRELTVDYTLAAGEHSLRVEYFDSSGDASILVWWEEIPSYPDWKAEYWPNRTLFGDPSLVRSDAEISFDWGLDAPAAGLPVDSFSVRWSQQLYFETGTYRFYAAADDGVRFYLDGDLIMSEWHQSGGEDVYTVTLRLSGWHFLMVEYYEGGGDALIYFDWNRLGEVQPPPVVGWQGTYWSNRRLEGDPVLVRQDAILDFDWGSASPAVGLPADDFSARWTRPVLFDADTYRFHALTDDGIRLWVGAELVIDGWADGASRELSADLHLARGEYEVRVEYYEHTGSAQVRVWWEKSALSPLVYRLGDRLPSVLPWNCEDRPTMVCSLIL